MNKNKTLYLKCGKHLNFFLKYYHYNHLVNLSNQKIIKILMNEYSDHLFNKNLKSYDCYQNYKILKRKLDKLHKKLKSALSKKIKIRIVFIFS